jgi:SHS2 domain-containing protein
MGAGNPRAGPGLPRIERDVYRWVEHTGELELSIEAPDEPAVFADAFAAFVELAGDEAGPGAELREIELGADGRETLLADWLEELVYLADAHRFVPDELTELTLAAGRLRAVVRGHRGAPSGLVKAVTHHRLSFAPEPEGGWRARMVLDV